MMYWNICVGPYTGHNDNNGYILVFKVNLKILQSQTKQSFKFLMWTNLTPQKVFLWIKGGSLLVHLFEIVKMFS